MLLKTLWSAPFVAARHCRARLSRTALESKASAKGERVSKTMPRNENNKLSGAFKSEQIFSVVIQKIYNSHEI